MNMINNNSSNAINPNMKQLFLSLLMPLLLVTSHLKSQSMEARHSKDSIGNGISVYARMEVKWKLTLNSLTLNTIASKLSTAYKPKIIKATVLGSPNTLKIEYDFASIQKEDILQVLKSEGIPDPYYIEKYNRYYLDNYGFITSDPVK